MSVAVAVLSVDQCSKKKKKKTHRHTTNEVAYKGWPESRVCIWEFRTIYLSCSFLTGSEVNQVSQWTVYSLGGLDWHRPVGSRDLQSLDSIIAAIWCKPPREPPFKNVYIRIVQIAEAKDERKEGKCVRPRKDFQNKFILCGENLYKYIIHIHRLVTERNLYRVQRTTFAAKKTATIRFSFVRLSIEWMYNVCGGSGDGGNGGDDSIWIPVSSVNSILIRRMTNGHNDGSV